MRLTPGELKVMRLLWEHGEMNPPEISQLYKPPIKDAALRACLGVLLEKKARQATSRRTRLFLSGGHAAASSLQVDAEPVG